MVIPVKKWTRFLTDYCHKVLDKYNVLLVEHSPYLSEFALWDFSVFQVQICIKSGKILVFRCERKKCAHHERTYRRKHPALLRTIENSYEAVWARGRVYIECKNNE